MKNHGYELEHNFGHGQKFLATTLAGLNLLVFAWHSALDLMEPPWQAAREAAAKRTSFLADLLTRVVLSGLLRIHRDLHYSAGTAQKSKNRMTQVKKIHF